MSVCDILAYILSLINISFYSYFMQSLFPGFSRFAFVLVHCSFSLLFHVSVYLTLLQSPLPPLFQSPFTGFNHVFIVTIIHIPLVSVTFPCHFSIVSLHFYCFSHLPLLQSLFHCFNHVSIVSYNYLLTLFQSFSLDMASYIFP